MLQFPHLLRKKKATTAKVGPTKAPDYVVLDHAGKWHVLECKGTQSGIRSRDKFLKNALAQKQVILINGAIRGERLAAGLSISNEDQNRDSELRVVDPDADPVLTLDLSREAEMQLMLHRLAVARALGVIGLSDAAVEVSLPANVLEAERYLKPVERRRARAKTEDRAGRAAGQLRSRELPQMEFRHRSYEGRTAAIELPELGRTSPFNSIAVRQGVSTDLLQELASVPSLFGDDVDNRIEKRLSNFSISIEFDEERTTLTYGDMLFSEIVLKRSD